LIQLEQVLPYDSACIFLLEADHLHAVAGRGFPTPDIVVGKQYPLDDLYRETESLSYPTILEDAQADARFMGLGDTTYVHGWMGVPLRGRGKTIGYLTLDSRETGAFTDQSAKLAQAFASQASVAIENSQLFEAARQRAQEAETLRQAGAIVAGTLMEEEAVQLILEQLARVVPCDSASVQMLGDGYLEIVGGFGWADVKQVIGLRFPVPGDNPNTHVVQQRQPYLLGDAPQAYPEFLQPSHAHIRSWLGVPLVVHDQVKGILAMDSTQPNYFSLEQARLASAFADQVAIVMENAHLYQEARQAAERRTILHRVSQEIVTASFDPEKIYNAIYKAATQLMPTEAFVITLVNADNPQAEAVFLIDKNGRAPQQLFDKRTGLTGKVLEIGRTLYIPDVEITPDFSGIHFGKREHTRSVLALPLQVGDRMIGMLSVQSYQPNAYTIEDQYLIEMLAVTAAIAIENSRLLKEIQWLAITDPLTNLYNRRGLFELGEREVERFRRFDRPFCVFMIDLDLFKLVNDTHGHAIGDQVLVGLTRGLQGQIREIDIIGKYGGEEIVVVLPETEIEAAMQAAERLRQFVQAHPFPTDRGDITVTISIGVAQISAHITDLATLIDRADSAMYVAKQAGRNLVRAYVESKDPGGS
jgi:diguanylate cyclase (GGDEF)-like protein